MSSNTHTARGLILEANNLLAQVFDVLNLNRKNEIDDEIHCDLCSVSFLLGQAFAAIGERSTPLPPIPAEELQIIENFGDVNIHTLLDKTYDDTNREDSNPQPTFTPETENLLDKYYVAGIW